MRVQRAPRILVLDRNRYRALLIERGLNELAVPPVIARFNSGTEVVRDLLATRYDVAIISVLGIDRPTDLINAARLARPDTCLVVIGSRETPGKVVTAIEAVADSYTSWDDDPGAPLPETIRRAIQTAAAGSPAAVTDHGSVKEPALMA